MSERWIADRMHQIDASGIRKVFDLAATMKDPINLSIGQPHFDTPQPIKDSLCGTKVLLKKHYDLIADNRAFFGDFDPFGDFDLLFGAARLNMKITDLPVRYRARVYGDTKIDRFAHGWLLLKMTAFGFKKFKMGL